MQGFVKLVQSKCTIFPDSIHISQNLFYQHRNTRTQNPYKYPLPPCFLPILWHISSAQNTYIKKYICCIRARILVGVCVKLTTLLVPWSSNIGHISLDSLIIGMQKMRVILIVMIVLVVAVTSPAGVDAGRVLTDNIQGSNIETYSMSVYKKTTNSMACWLQMLASGPSPRGRGHWNITGPGFQHKFSMYRFPIFFFFFNYCSSRRFIYIILCITSISINKQPNVDVVFLY